MKLYNHIHGPKSIPISIFWIHQKKFKFQSYGSLHGNTSLGTAHCCDSSYTQSEWFVGQQILVVQRLVECCCDRVLKEKDSACGTGKTNYL